MTKERFVELCKAMEEVRKCYGYDFIRIATWGQVEHVLAHFCGVSAAEARAWNEYKEANNL